MEPLRRCRGADGRVHTSFNITATATGRLSSSAPNLQGVPAHTHGKQVRRSFITEPGWCLVSADYSQIELRMMAQLAGDEALLEAFSRGADVHALTAAALAGSNGGTVTDRQRQLGKTVNFGVIYGMGARALAAAAGISAGQAKKFIERFFETYPGVARYRDSIPQQLQESGFVETIAGRRRFFRPGSHVSSSTATPTSGSNGSGTTSSNGDEHEAANGDTGASGEEGSEAAGQQLCKAEGPVKVRNRHVAPSAEAGVAAAALRAAVNAPIQGSAADVMRLALLRVAAALRSLRAELLLTVHDEVLLECPKEEVDEVVGVLVRVMEEQVAQELAMTVPLRVNVSVGANWLEMATYDKLHVSSVS